MSITLKSLAGIPPAKAIGVFDLVKKGRDPFLFGEVFIYRDFTDVNQFIGCCLC